MKVFIRFFPLGMGKTIVRWECVPIVGTSLFECARCKKTIYPKVDKICRFCAADVIVEE